MAEAPNDPRFPPSSVVDFDDVYDGLVRIKEQHFPEHTARDKVDPYNQIISLVSALGQYALGRINYALMQLSPRSATSRRALIAILEIPNRPLRPISPAQGPIYARVKSKTLTAGDVIVGEGQRIAPPSVQDPVFTVDEEVSFPAVSTFHVSHYDDSTGITASLTAPYTMSVSKGDALVVELDALAFNSMAFDFTTKFGSRAFISVEHYNDEYGPVTGVVNLGATLRFNLNDYLWKDYLTVAPTGMPVTIRHKPSGLTESATVRLNSLDLVATTSFIGQTSPSASPSDYEVLAEWRPVRSTVDDTGGFTVDAALDMKFELLMDQDVRWARNSSGRFAVRMRFVGMGANPDPSPLVIATIASDDNLWVVSTVTQGVRQRSTVGQTDGTAFQFLPVASQPISERVASPAITIQVGSDDEWFVVDDFSNSDSSSKHALFREDPDDGWGVLFGDGKVGSLPADGQSVKIVFRTGSVQPGNLDAGSEVRAIGGVGQADTWTIFRGTDGYAPAEASDRESALRFRVSILPQLALRTESVVTRSEIVTAMTGGAPNRATFQTRDGRLPFSRAAFSLVGAGDRQYRVIVVGSESDADGLVLSPDLTEAEEWLNGTRVGVEIVGGHGSNNTQAVVTEFTPRYLLPTITVTIPNPNGVAEQVDQIVRAFIRPHARGDDKEFRFEFGGLVPLPLLFSALWAAVSKRTFITVSVTDGTDTYGSGDTIQLMETELPVLDPSYDPTVNIIVVEG